MKNCTRCGEEFKDFRLTIYQAISTERLTAIGKWENLPNVSIETSEVLCNECFDKFSKIVSEAMNIKNDKK